MTDKIHPSIQEQPADRAQTALRLITSAVDIMQPGLGSVFGELIGVVLPANREQRIAVFATRLDRRLRDLDKRLDELIGTLSAEQLTLVEDGLRASARAVQEDRIARISDVVAAGLINCDDTTRQREMLDLLSSLSDVNLAHLTRFANWRGRQLTFDRPITMGAWNALSVQEQEAIENAKRLVDLSEHKLVSLGLLEIPFALQRKFGQEDELVIERQDPRLTPLGYVFCLHVGLWPDGERPLNG